MDALLAWGREQGVVCDDIDFGGEGGRDAIATRAIGAERCVFRVPQHLMMYPSQAFEDPVYGPAFRRLSEVVGEVLDDRFLLCLLLILERAKGTSSRWAPYLDILPTSYNDPFWWTESDARLLDGTGVGRAIEFYQHRLRDLASWRDHLLDACRSDTSGPASPDEESWGMPDISPEGYRWARSAEAVLWARSTVWSRAFNVRLGGCVRRKTLALMPVVDMLDHHPAHHVIWHTGPTGDDDFEFITLTPIAQGQPVYNNYGYKSNGELLLGYGFSLPNNPADFFHISVALSPGNPASGETEDEARVCSGAPLRRRTLLAELSLPTDHFLRRKDPLPPQLVTTAAVSLLPECFAAQLREAQSQGAHMPTLGNDKVPVTLHSNGHVAASHPTEEAMGDAGMLDDGAGDGSEGRSGTVVGEQAGETAGCNRFPGGYEVPSTKSTAEAGGHEAGGKAWSPRDLGFPCPPGILLQTLHALRQQLRAKVEAVRGPPPEEDLAEAAEVAGTNPHAAMALEYRARQKEIGFAGVVALGAAIGHVVHMASLDAARVQDSVGGEAAAIICEATASEAMSQMLQANAPAVRELPTRDTMKAHPLASHPDPPRTPPPTPAGLAASLGVPITWHGWAYGLQVTRDVTEGDVLVSVVRDAPTILRGSDRDALVKLLIRLLVSEGLVGDVVPEEGAEVDMAGLAVRQYAARVAAPPSIRLASLGMGSLVEGTAAEDALQGECAEIGQAAAELSAGGALDGVPLHKRAQVYAWAAAVVDRCALPSPDGLQLVPVISALPPALRGVVANVVWEDDKVALRAACPLREGSVLSSAPELLQHDLEGLLLAHGPEALLVAEAAQPGESGGASHMQRAIYEMGVAPPSGSPHCEEKLELLDACGLADSHFLWKESSQERLLSAIAICAAKLAQLKSLGSDQLVALANTCARATAKDDVSAVAGVDAKGASTGTGEAQTSSTGECPFVQLAALQKTFVRLLLQDPHLSKLARTQARALLKETRAELDQVEVNQEGEVPVKTSRAVLGCQLYRRAMRDIVNHHYRRVTLKENGVKSRLQQTEGNAKRRKTAQA